jgi:hypothetical protein
MKSRALTLVVVAAFLLQPASLEAEKFKTGGYPLHGGILREDNSCPAATHALFNECSFTNSGAIIFGPSDTVSCPQPVVVAKYIYPAPPPPGPCPGE